MNQTDTMICAKAVERLYAERRAYARRIADLGGDPNNVAEINACMRKIDAINEALVSLARKTADHDIQGNGQSGAALVSHRDRV